MSRPGRPPAGGPRLQVVADLRLDLDGRPATITGAGSQVHVRTVDPGRLWGQVVGAPLPAGVDRSNGPRAVGQVANGLAAAGLTVTVEGPNGPLVVLGKGGRSIRGRLFTGSSHVRPGAIGALRPLALAQLRRNVFRPRRRVAAVALLAGALTAAGTARRRARR